MASSTTNYDLIMPDGGENYSVNVANSNMSDLDEIIKNISDAADAAQSTGDAAQSSANSAMSRANAAYTSADSARAAASSAQATATAAANSANSAISEISDLADDVYDGSAIGDGAITAAKIAAGAVTSTKIAGSAVTTARINNLAVTTAKINNLAVTSEKIAYGAVTALQLDPTALLVRYYRDPYEMGYWATGLPVWRIAILKELDYSDTERGYYDLTASDLGVRDLGGITAIVNSYIRQYAPNVGAESSTMCQLQEEFQLTLPGNVAFTRLAGYIEFVTPSTNIVS